MPTHLDIQVGEYGSSMGLNQAAVAADLKLHAQSPSRFTIYFGYVIHNMEFCAWAAMLAGCKAAALAAAEQIDTFLTDEVLRSHPIMPTFNELYLTTRLMVLVRFGLWAEVLATPFKSDAALHAAHTLFLHYARGVAFGATADLPSARAEERAFLALLAQTEPGHRRKHNVDIVQMGEVAVEVLAAELLYREGAYEQAFGRLEAGVARSMPHARRRAPALPRSPALPPPTTPPICQPADPSALRPNPSSLARSDPVLLQPIATPPAPSRIRFDALPYDEPHGWLISVRQTLGALLTEEGRHEAATKVYTQDLALFPANVWSLTGLKICHQARAGAPTPLPPPPHPTRTTRRTPTPPHRADAWVQTLDRIGHATYTLRAHCVPARVSVQTRGSLLSTGSSRWHGSWPTCPSARAAPARCGAGASQRNAARRRRERAGIDMRGLSAESFLTLVTAGLCSVFSLWHPRKPICTHRVPCTPCGRGSCDTWNSASHHSSLSV